MVTGKVSKLLCVMNIKMGYWFGFRLFVVVVEIGSFTKSISNSGNESA